MKLYDVMRKEKEFDLKRHTEDGEIVSKEQDISPIKNRARFVLTRKKIFIFLGVGAFFVAVYALGVTFVLVKIIVNERRIPFSISNAILEVANQEKTDAERLSFQAMVVTKTITRELYGSALTTSNTKATGSVVFFNEYSTAKQTVKKGTTLTSPEGKRYVTLSQVVVPGYTLVNKKKVAGVSSSSVNISAVDVGESYNSQGTTLSVSGWTNASKTFYARSTVISGGEAGVSHTLTEAEREEAIATLQVQLVERLKRETRAQIPKDFVTFPELQFPIIDSDSFVFKGGKVRFPASMTGSMVSYLIPRSMLEQAVATKALTGVSYTKVAIPDIGDLSFDLASPVPTDPKIIPDTIQIEVSGSGTIIAKVPIDKIKEGIIGKPRRTFDEVLASIPEIDSARFRLFPFWAPRFPSQWGRINVLTQ